MSIIVKVYYINSLSGFKPQPYVKKALGVLRARGVQIEQIPIDWYADESLQVVIERARQLIRRNITREGEVLLIGVSAGGSLALNIFGVVKSPRLRLVTICSRMNEKELSRYDWRTLDRLAHIGTSRPSYLFRDSVLLATKQTIPTLTDTEKRRILILRNVWDEVVPARTMTIPGVKCETLPVIGHRKSLAYGLEYLAQITSRSSRRR